MIDVLLITKDVFSIILILVGCFFFLAGALGVLRLPDFYSRIHAAGMTDTLGAELIVLGLIIQALPHDYIWAVKLTLVGLFLFVTSPTATHAVANAAMKAGLKPKTGRYQVPDIAAEKAAKEEAH